MIEKPMQPVVALAFWVLCQVSGGGNFTAEIRGKYESQYEYYCWRNG